MAHVRTANKHGTAAQLAEHSPGYSASGESEFTRYVSHGGKSPGPGLMRATASMSRLDQLIFKNCRELARLEERIATEHNPEAVNRHVHNAAIKRRFIDTLRAQQKAGRK